MLSGWGSDHGKVAHVKQCSKCGEPKPLEQFYKKPTGKYGVAALCKACDKARSRDWRVKNGEWVRLRRREYRAANLDSVRERGRNWAESNPDRVKAYMRQWQVANPEALQLHQRRRRARKVGNGVFVVTVEEIRRMLGQPCYLCNNAQSVEIDHVIPIKRGGRHAIGNLLGACRSCNAHKSAMFLFEFKVRRGVLTSNQTCERGNCEPC